MDSILASIKKMLGLDVDYEAFDTDIIVYINSAFMTLNDLGVGPDKTFFITGENEQWTDFFETEDIDAIKTYVYLKVRLVFDPPTSSFVLESINKQIQELEWRLNVRFDKGGDDNE